MYFFTYNALLYYIYELLSNAVSAYFRQIDVQAALYQTDFRPVPLEEFIKVGNTIYDKKMDIVRTIPRAADLGGKDPDHIVELCNEVGVAAFLFK